MPLDYKKFAEVYGADIIDAPVTPAELATPEQIAKVTQLVETLNIQPEQIGKWFKKCDVEAWDEMTAKQISDLIDFLTKKIEGVK
jgi:hypothetical protein